METDPTREQEPKEYFTVTNLDGGIRAFGEIPREHLEALVGERFPVWGYLLRDQDVTHANIQASDIAETLILAGHDSEYPPLQWWSGYASAFKGVAKSHAGNNYRSLIHIPVSCGKVDLEVQDTLMAE